MRYLIAACFLLATTVRGQDEHPTQWTCIARTPVLQRAFSGTGPTEAEARANALNECQDHSLVGCYIESCDNQ